MQGEGWMWSWWWSARESIPEAWQKQTEWFCGTCWTSQEQFRGFPKQVGALSGFFHWAMALGLCAPVPAKVWNKQRQRLVLRHMWAHLQWKGRWKDLVVEETNDVAFEQSFPVASGRSWDVLQHLRGSPQASVATICRWRKRKEAAAAVLRIRMALSKHQDFFQQTQRKGADVAGRSLSTTWAGPVRPHYKEESVYLDVVSDSVLSLQKPRCSGQRRPRMAIRGHQEVTCTVLMPWSKTISTKWIALWCNKYRWQGWVRSKQDETLKCATRGCGRENDKSAKAAWRNREAAVNRKVGKSKKGKQDREIVFNPKKWGPWWQQVASERKTTRASQKGATQPMVTGSAQSTALPQGGGDGLHASRSPKLSTHDPMADFLLSGRSQQALIELQEEAKLDVLENLPTDQRWSTSIRDGVVWVGEPSQRHTGQNICRQMTGGPHSDCKVKLAYEEQGHHGRIRHRSKRSPHLRERRRLMRTHQPIRWKSFRRNIWRSGWKREALLRELRQMRLLQALKREEGERHLQKEGRRSGRLEAAAGGKLLEQLQVGRCSRATSLRKTKSELSEKAEDAVSKWMDVHALDVVSLECLSSVFLSVSCTWTCLVRNAGFLNVWAVCLLAALLACHVFSTFEGSLFFFSKKENEREQDKVKYDEEEKTANHDFSRRWQTRSCGASERPGHQAVVFWPRGPLVVRLTSVVIISLQNVGSLNPPWGASLSALRWPREAVFAWKQGWSATREVDGASVRASKGGAAAIEAFCLLQDREEGTASSKALAFPEHLSSAPCFQKTVDGLRPSSPKQLVQLKQCGTMKVHQRG